MAERTFGEEPQYVEPEFNAGNPANNRNIQLEQLQQLENTKLKDVEKAKDIYETLNNELLKIREKIIEIKNQKSGGKRKSSKRRPSKRRPSKRRLSKRLRTRK